MFGGPESAVTIKCIKPASPSPDKVLERMRKFIQVKPLRPGDEAWIVVDRDNWPEKPLDRIDEWGRSNEQFGFALSNPNFEYWLLLHYEEGVNIKSPRDCLSRLKSNVPDYDKGIDPRLYSLDKVQEAVRRAVVRDQPRCVSWPRRLGTTTVYRMVDRLLQAIDEL